ncbi:VAC14 [Acrasis kona]|uniref:VAC14 n=1 Tax=Acrasis kona TaxID=1008807 RepID=A0AAW2Z6Y2_9EUKA
MKDIVTEDENFDIEKFIPVIRARITTNNPFVRQFLLGWIMVLDSVPDIDMLVYLPQFLDGLFSMLSDPNKEIEKQACTVIDEFVSEIETVADAVEYESLVPILITHCQSQVNLAKQKALHWIYKFLFAANNFEKNIGPKKDPKQLLLPFHCIMLQAILPNLSHPSDDIRSITIIANTELTKMVSTCNQVSYKDFLTIIGKEIQNYNVQTRVASLVWLELLLNKDDQQVLKQMNKPFEVKLLQCLGDADDRVVNLNLKVLASISVTNEDNFVKVLSLLTRLFRSEDILLKRAGYIIRELSVMLNPENIFRVFARILLSNDKEQQLPISDYDDNVKEVSSTSLMTHLEFCSVMVQTLNTILLTSKELTDLRKLVKKGLSTPESGELFLILYKSWCHNPVATLSLCLLSKAYKHASALVASFAEIEITVSFLVQIDNLVQMLESPIFADLRLQLLEPQKNPYLLKTFYGILMLLPQGPAYDKLNRRLECVNTLSLLHLIDRKDLNNSITQNGHSRNATEDTEDKESTELLKHFSSIQKAHKRTYNADL